jgi:alpha-1,2-mannosyltransferase
MGELLSFITAGSPDHGVVGIPPAQPQDRAVPKGASSARGNWHWTMAIGIAAIAFVFRLVPVLRGGGLFGLGNYDDGVYYAAATAIAHGLLPYQDFLLLHPPGVPLLLTPFALVAQLTSDSYGFAAARVAWMLLGALNAVLIWRILKPIGLTAALFGALGYAVLYPAVYADKSTLLEGPATTALLLAIVLLEPLSESRSLSRRGALTAGALLGLTVTFKAWGVVTVVIVLGWLLLIRQVRVALQFLLASMAAAALICLPFFATAPGAMWNQIVRDQIFRRGGNDVTAFARLDEIAGLGIVGRSHAAITVIAVVALICCAALAWSYREGRLPVLLLVGQGAFLLVTPTWFPHYAGFTAGAVALVAGAAIGRVIALARVKPARIAVTIAATAALLVYASGWSDITFGRRLPSNFQTFTASAPGCVTTDDATTLVATDSLSRNLSRGCRFVADLGGNSHDMEAASGIAISRNRNQEFQRFALNYLRTGSVTILVRFSGGRGFNARTTAVLDRWPLLAHSGKYQVRQPVALGRSAIGGSPKPQRR